LPVISIHRSGGFVGVNQQLTVSANGAWSFVDADNGARNSGTLGAAQRSELTRLATDPRLAAEARATPSGVCNDGFQYVVLVGRVATRFDDCGGSDHPAFDALINKLSGWTPL
jgi:hypothetical protein